MEKPKKIQVLSCKPRDGVRNSAKNDSLNYRNIDKKNWFL